MVGQEYFELRAVILGGIAGLIPIADYLKIISYNLSNYYHISNIDVIKTL